jgi:hypothetical protein
MRRHSVCDEGGAGVAPRDRGEERALDGAESSSRIVANVLLVAMVAEGIVGWRPGVCPL